jgi:NAD-dependent dihydropyrimidine dehydrogenase PreA subunit/flavodoxin
LNKNTKAVYFSATGTTKKIVTGIAEEISHSLGGKKIENIDFTLPASRKEPLYFAEQDLVVFGLPVYAGRVPNVLLKYFNSIRGNGASAIAVVVYGHRHYDDALIELKDILELNGLQVIAGGAFIGEHSFSRILGMNRPDEQDMSIVAEFARQICKKMTCLSVLKPLFVKGNRPYRAYSKPKDKDNQPMVLHKITPKTNSDCINCKLCVDLCPMGSIDVNDVSMITGICIRCCACIKMCPMQAKYFDDANYLWHKNELEVSYTYPRREPEFFL